MAKRRQQAWRWHLAVALRRRYRAQSTREANHLMVVESTTWMVRLKRRISLRPVPPYPKHSCRFCRCPKHAQEQLFGHDRIAMFARIGLPVAVQRGCPNNPNQPAMVTQRIAHIIESDCVGELGAAYRHRLAPCAESAHLGINLRFHARV